MKKLLLFSILGIQWISGGIFLFCYLLGHPEKSANAINVGINLVNPIATFIIGWGLLFLISISINKRLNKDSKKRNLAIWIPFIFAFAIGVFNPFGKIFNDWLIIFFPYTRSDFLHGLSYLDWGFHWRVAILDTIFLFLGFSIPLFVILGGAFLFNRLKL